jgi:integrase
MSGVVPAALDPRFAVFLSWVAAQKARALSSTKKRDQFSDKTAQIYESLWRGWVDWLGARDRQWQGAEPADVRKFLDGPAPAPKDRRTRNPIEPKKMANYTQQRYWSVLQAVYSHAQTNQLVEQSPCLGIAVKPQISDRSLKRQVMHPGVLQLLRDPAHLVRFLPVEDERQWWVLRDRAAVALAAHCGLSAGELIALRGQDLRDGSRMLGPLQPQLPGVEQAPRTPAVDIPATNDRPQHTVPIPPAALKAIEPWLARRSELLLEQRKAFALGSLKQQPLAPADAPVLLSREAPAGEPLPAVDSPTLWYSFRKCMDAAIKAAGHDLKDGYVARGPGILRNTVIADWAATLGPAQAAALAGLKPASLRAAATP